MATILSIRDNVVHGTINRFEKEAECEGLDLVENGASECVIDVALCNSFGFGGHNSSIVFARFNG